jgi:hypothetical protein
MITYFVLCLHVWLHQIKAKLDDMRASIERVHGPLPDDLQDEGRGAAGSAGTSAASSPGGAAEGSGRQSYITFPPVYCKF